VGKKQVIFEKHKIYSQRPNDISDEAWNGLLPVSFFCHYITLHYSPLLPIHPSQSLHFPHHHLICPQQEGRGFVYIPDWKDYDLPPGQNTTFGMIYSTAVFHQMHCLGQVRRFSWMFLDAIDKNSTQDMLNIKEMFIKMDHAEHMNHCFDYLRQTIQCGGDMAMEWPRTEPNGLRIAVDGWGIPHECKDWVGSWCLVCCGGAMMIC
jgi:hypothetical protein